MSKGTQRGHVEGSMEITAAALPTHSLILIPFYSVPEPHACPLQESSTCGWLMGGGTQSSGRGGSKLVVTENKSPSQGCRWLLVSNCYKHWVSGAVRNASEHSECLSYVQLKQ